MKAYEVAKYIHCILQPDTLVSSALQCMAEQQLSYCAIINTDREFQSFLTIHDLLAQIDSPKRLVNELKTQNFSFISKDITLSELVNRNEANFIIFEDDKCLYLTQDMIRHNLLLERVKSLEISDVFFESSYDGIYITDGNAKTIRINSAYERITGLSRDQLLGKNMKELVDEGFVSESGSIAALSSGSSITLSQTFKSGRKGLITSIPVKDQNGKVICVVTNVRDITELSELRDSAEKNKQLVEKYHTEIEVLKAQLLENSSFKVSDPKMLEILRFANKIAQTDSTVLLLGESGVGKEEIAKVIHKNSPRHAQSYIKINCGAIPETLIESELFGYEKGAFTGSSSKGKKGLFEAADQGTLFLDEIGELPLEMQVKLLRVLQEGEFTRIGGTEPIKANVRILSATNRDLEQMVQEGTFRQDLYYRLNVIPIRIPALRERKKDIVPIATYTLSRLNEKYGWNKTFSQDALDALEAYNWPGNVRELNNVVERTVVTSPADKIDRHDLPATIAEVSGIYTDAYSTLLLEQAVTELEKRMIDKAFEKYGNVRDAASSLGIAPSTFVRKRKKYDK